MKKITVNLQVKLLLYTNEDVDLKDVVNELDYNFSDTTGTANIVDTEIEEFKVIDSR